MNSDLATPGQMQRFNELEAAVASLPPAETPVTHYFAPGVYAREIFIRAGVMLTGKIHKQEHLNIISSGRILVIGMDGSQKEVVAPCAFVSKPGTRRAGLALEDATWTTIHPTLETDLAKIEEEVIEKYDNPLVSESRRTIQ